MCWGSKVRGKGTDLENRSPCNEGSQDMTSLSAGSGGGVQGREGGKGET